MAEHGSAKAQHFDGDDLGRISEELRFPLRFTGHARMAVDRLALGERIAGELRIAAQPRRVTEERVRAYCVDRGIARHRFEQALLGEAFKVVSATELIERLRADLVERMPTLLTSPYACSAELRDGKLLLKVGAARSEPKYVIVGDQPAWEVLPGYSTVSGSLSVLGQLDDGTGRSSRIDAGWSVASGTTCAALGRQAGAYFARPVQALVGCVAGDALSRFNRALPTEIAAVLDDSREPTFVNVERLLRLGRLTHSTRVYLLYWKRLRDYLIWSVTS